MRLSHMVVGADHAALENGEEVFSGVAVSKAAHANILTGRMNDGRVPCKLAANAGVDRAFVGHEVRSAIDIGNDQRAQSFGVHIGDMERTGVAFAANERDDGFLRFHGAGGAVALLSANIGFIGFNDTVGATERAAAVGHGFTDTVAEEPRGFVGDAKHTLHLLRAHALL